MSWTFTLFLVNALATGSIIVVAKHAPDQVQRFVLFGLFLSSITLTLSYYTQLIHPNLKEPLQIIVHRIAHEIEHAAVILYILRIFVANQEKRCLPNLFHSSPTSQG